MRLCVRKLARLLQKRKRGRKGGRGRKRGREKEPEQASHQLDDKTYKVDHGMVIQALRNSCKRAQAKELEKELDGEPRQAKTQTR